MAQAFYSFEIGTLIFFGERFQDWLYVVGCGWWCQFEAIFTNGQTKTPTSWHQGDVLQSHPGF